MREHVQTDRDRHFYLVHPAAELDDDWESNRPGLNCEVSSLLVIRAVQSTPPLLGHREGLS